MIDYDVYRMSGKELFFELGRILVCLILWGMLFFRSAFGVLLLLPYGVRMYHQRLEEKKRLRRVQLKLDFKEVVLSIASSLQAGYSLEEAVYAAGEELDRLYPGGDRAMRKELEWMKNHMKIRIPVEQLFEELAYRSGLEEIRNFASVLSIARKQGGNLVKISRNTASHIARKIQVQAEIYQILSGKIYEKNIMLFMPYLILIYLHITNPGYLDVLYQNWTGRVLMGFCLALILAAGEWAQWIIRIEE